MNVYQISAPLGMPTQQAPKKAERTQSPRDGRKPLAHYSMLARTLAQDRDTGRENERRQVGTKDVCPLGPWSHPVYLMR